MMGIFQEPYYDGPEGYCFHYCGQKVEELKFLLR